MKESHSSGYLFWVTFCCVLYLGAASDDDLLDFDFTDLKEIDWNYKTDNSKESSPKEPTKKNIITFDDDTDLLEDNQVRPFDWREKILRTALSKALMNKALRQKFVEVMPILRVLSKQQRLALSALITSQINAKKGTELKLSQVRIMFGDDKSLILPIVFDIANLVRNSARKYIEFDYSLRDFADFSKPKKTYERRNLELTSEELAAEENDADIGTLPAAAHVPTHFGLDGLEDFMSDEVLDPKEINEELETLKETTNNNTGLEEVNSGMKPNDDPDGDITYPLDINMQLQNDVPTLTLLKQGKTKTREYSTEAQNPHENSMKQPAAFSSTTDPKATLKRKRRSVREAKEFVHKLVRAVSFSLNGDDLPRSGRAIKLNTTAFASPKETTFRPVSHAAMFSTAASTATISTTTASLPKPTAHESYEPYQLVEDLAFASLNGSEILLDSTEDNEENDLISTVKSEPDDEILPSPEELISGPRYHFSPNKILSSRKRLVPHKRKRLHVRARPKTGVRGNGVAPPKKCERFTPSMCIKTDDYPIDHIMGSIRRHRNAMTALLAEYDETSTNELDNSDDFDEYLYDIKRREDNDIQAELCQSIIRYARPQKARSASGEWKYIVNTGQHTQTLRLEKCLNPQESCNYLANSYRSHCAQVYNYHRLLSWDKARGLHVDIFKVPTCCSCQIDGYKQQFPLEPEPKIKGFSPVYKGGIYKQFDYNDDDDEDEDFEFAINRKHHKDDISFDANVLISDPIKTKLPQATVSSYLSPPLNEEFEDYMYKNPSIVVEQNPTSSSAHSSSNTYLRELQNRRQSQLHKDNRSDQEMSPSEQHTQRELPPEVAASATAALRPSQPAPEPFVPLLPQLQYGADDPPSLIPMPTKSHQLQQQPSYQILHHHQHPQQLHQHHHQQQPQQEPKQQYPVTQTGQRLYRPTITPAHDMSSKTNPGYAYHTRSRLPTRDTLAAKRPIQRLRPSTSTKYRPQQSHRHHRRSRSFML